MSNLIIETDIGRDPDDFFALLYLVSAGVNIKAITVSPGDPDQIALVKFILRELDLDIPVGADIKDRNKKSLTGFHIGLMDKYKATRYAEADEYGPELITKVFDNFPNSELFVIGPAQGIGKYLIASLDKEITKATIQGGFISYETHGLPCRRLSKFEGRTTYQSFNLNGDITGAKALLNAKIINRYFVSKNVNHTVALGYEQYSAMLNFSPKNRAMELFLEGATKLKKEQGKKMHDLVAAVCHLHPEVATWVKAKLYSVRNKDNFIEWGAELDESGDNIIVDINYEKFWEYAFNGI